MPSPLRSLFSSAAVIVSLSLAAPLAASAFQQGALLKRMDTNISEAEVLQAQQGWCAGLLAIGSAFRSGGYSQAKAKASSVLDQAYAYQYGAVAFKPTLATEPQAFRPTKEGALSYFVGGNPNYPKDHGFAIKPWQTCTVRNQVIQLHGMFAATMGNVDFIDSSGATTTVDKTWSFLKEPNGSIRIVLHHSSLPYKLIAK